jgi:predicted permease
MQLFRRLRHTSASLLARARFERDLRDELREHVRRRAEALERTGLSPAEALRRARIEFGALEAYKEQCRDAGGMTPVRPLLGIGSDLKLAARRLAATPLFLAFAVLSLSIGVAVPTTVYSTLYELMWRPVGVERPGDVVLVSSGASSSRWRVLASVPDFEDLQRTQQSFAAIAAFTSFGQPLTAASVSEVVDIEAVSGRFFDVVGVPPLVGRLLQPADQDRSAAVVVLGEQFWRRRLDADPGIVGRAVRIGSQPFEVVGVVPESFLGLTSGGPRRADAWMPLASVAQTGIKTLALDDRDRRALSIAGRLAPGRTIETSTAEMHAFGAALDNAYPITVPGPPDRPRLPTKRLWSTIAVGDRNPLPGLRIDLLMLGLVFLVLVVACTNLGNLLLSRGAERAHEFSVRRALGASRWRLVRELLAESLLIVIVAAAVTYPAIGALMWLITMEIPVGHGSLLIEPVLRVPAVLVAAGALLASMLVFGLEPALALTRDTMSLQLSSEAGAAPPTRRRRQRAFIRWQVATSVCFFLIAAVLARLLVKEARHDSGVAIDELAIATVHFSLQGWDETRARRAMARAQELGAEYGQLRSVAISTGLPYGLQMTPTTEITTPDRPFVKGIRAETAGVLVASPNIFATLGVPIVDGRGFDDRDGPAAAKVAVLSELTARKLFGTREAVGRQLTYKPPYGPDRNTPRTVTVVGISKDTDVDRLMSRDDLLLYLPFSQVYLPNLVLVARTSRGTTAFGAVRVLQTILRRADFDLSTGTSGPAAWLAAGPWVAARAAGAVATGLGLLTLILSMVGLYGVQSQIVAHRTREVGIRMALGALTAQIQRMVMREGFRPVAEGFVLGLFFGTVARAGIRAMFVGAVDLVDPFAIAVVPIPLAIAAFLACYVPAMRAARVDPNVALRHL